MKTLKIKENGNIYFMAITEMPKNEWNLLSGDFFELTQITIKKGFVVNKSTANELCKWIFDNISLFDVIDFDNIIIDENSATKIRVAEYENPTRFSSLLYKEYTINGKLFYEKILNGINIEQTMFFINHPTQIAKEAREAINGKRTSKYSGPFKVKTIKG